MSHVITGTQNRSVLGIQFENLEKHHVVPSKFIDVVAGYTGIAVKCIVKRVSGLTSVPEVTVHKQVESNAQLLDHVYQKSGLSWIELSNLFGVSVRLIHFWRQNQKQMNTTHEFILRNVWDLISINSEKAKFVLRNFFLTQVLRDKNVLSRLQNGDEDVFNQIYEGLSNIKSSRPRGYSVSENFYVSKVPQGIDKVFASKVDIVESKNIKPKVRTIKKQKRYKSV